MYRNLKEMCVFTALLVQGLCAQDIASIFGTITDPAGAVVPAAAVTAKRLPSGPSSSTITDKAGRYNFPALVPDKYELSVDVPGFKKYVRIGGLNAGQHSQWDIALEVGSASESVTVNATSSLALSTSTGTYARARERIPAQGIRRHNAPWNTAQYDSYQENEFASTRTSPLSTFGVDVDTASYSNTRRFLNEGHLPPPAAVRIEELVNYFTYNYPQPAEGKPVSITTQLAASPWNRERQLLLVGLRTKTLALDRIPPSRLTFLIDVSGSMMPRDRLPLVKQALRILVEQLRPEDSVGLVVYAGNAGVVLEPTSGDRKDVILGAIDRLEAGGSTHGSAGIRAAYELARRAFLKDGNNRVILATDGDFNVGVSSDGELVQIIEKERGSGVFLTVIGVGTDNLKDSKMVKLADNGNGNYYYLDSVQEARKVFLEQLTGTLVTVAKDVKLQIEFNPAKVKAWRLIGYEKRILRAEKFNDDKKDAGDLGSGHQVTAIYEIIPAGSREDVAGVDGLRYQRQPRDTSRTRSAELAWVKLRHKQPQGDKSELLEWPVVPTSMDFDTLPVDARFAFAVAEYGLLLRQSKFAGGASFDQVLRLARDALGNAPDTHRMEFLDLVRRARELAQDTEARVR